MIATCCDCGRAFRREADERWKVRCLDCWRARREAFEQRQYRRQERPREQQAPADPLRDELREHLRELVLLSHPDKHNGSQLSTKVTQWLLSLRDRIGI